MRIVDGHMHVFDRPAIPLGVRRAWARQAAGRRHHDVDPENIEPRVMLGQSDPTGTITLAAFDRAGVETGVVPVVDWSLIAESGPEDFTIRQVHSWMAELADTHRGRLAWCAGLDPRHPDAEKIAEDALSLTGSVGFKLYPAAGWALDDPAHSWVFGFVRERDVPVVVHTSPLGGDPLATHRSRPSIVGVAMQAHPDLTWVLAHAGHDAWWAEACDIANGWWRVYLDISLWQEVADRDVKEFRYRVAIARRRAGAHRLVFGSDIAHGPSSDPEGEKLERWIDQCMALAEPFAGEPPILSVEELELLMHANARRLYRLAAHD